MILAKNRNSLQQHIRFSQKLTLSKYYHKIEVSYQQNGHEEIFSEVPKKEILLLMLKRNKIFIKEKNISGDRFPHGQKQWFL